MASKTRPRSAFREAPDADAADARIQRKETEKPGRGRDRTRARVSVSSGRLPGGAGSRGRWRCRLAGRRGASLLAKDCGP